jgi:hypothetical protein
VQFQPTGFALVTINIRGWNADDEVNTLIVTGTAQIGKQARIAGVQDGRGTVNYDFDLDNLPWSPAFRIVSGMTGIVYNYISPISAIANPIIIKKVHSESAVETEVKGSFDWEFNSLAGVQVYPLTA